MLSFLMLSSSWRCQSPGQSYQSSTRDLVTEAMCPTEVTLVGSILPSPKNSNDLHLLNKPINIFLFQSALFWWRILQFSLFLIPIFKKHIKKQKNSSCKENGLLGVGLSLSKGYKKERWDCIKIKRARQLPSVPFLGNHQGSFCQTIFPDSCYLLCQDCSFFPPHLPMTPCASIFYDSYWD